MKLNFYTFRFLVAPVLLSAALAPDTAQAQQLGIANSNYAGTHSLYTNPSAIADSRHAFYLNLFSMDAGVTNNYLRYDSPVSLFKIYKDELELDDAYVKENLNGKTKLLSAALDFRGPAFMLRLSPRSSVAFSTRVRGAMQANNITEDMARLYKVTADEAQDMINKLSGGNTLNLNANVYSEIGVSFAQVVADRDRHFLKAGVTVKRLAGGYSAYLNNEDTQFKLEEREIAGSNEMEDVLVFDRIKAQYGYVSDDALGDMETPDLLRLLTGRDTPGKGWGVDVGLTYEFRPNLDKHLYQMDGKQHSDQERNKYKYRIGIALMDVGGITYKDPRYTAAYAVDAADKELNLSDLEGAEEAEDVVNVLNQAFGTAMSDKKTSFRSGLPTALNLNLDYKVGGAFYVNATLIQGLRGKNAIGMRQNSLVALTPRLEFRKFELSVPVALQNNYTVPTVGAMVRFLNFYVGSDNIGGAFNIGNPYGANAYIGVSLLPILKRNKKDKDNDGVSNAMDKCKTVPGTLEKMGCPE